MNVTTTPAPKSSVLVEVELPPERLSRAVDQAVQRLGRRTKVPGFRPGKAPRAMLERVLGPGVVLDEAVEHLVQDAYRDALVEKEILPLANGDVEIVQAEEGKPVIFKATVPVRPDVELGDYRNFNFRPEIETIDDAKVDKVIDELRDQQATLRAVDERGAQDGDYAVISYQGTVDGEPFEGGASERMPLVIGEERLIPGFEAHLTGLRPGDAVDFDIAFPDDYPVEALKGEPAHFAVELRELREKVMPAADDDLARSVGDFSTLAEVREAVRERLERNALDKARHEFADRIIEYAVANASLDLPDVLIDQEVEVMHDEFRASLARQGITEDAYRKATDKSEKDLHEEFRPQAEKRVKVLLVLSRIAETEGVDVDDADVEGEVEQARQRYDSNARLVRYFESDRGRSFIRSTLRRSKVVEKLIDDWLAAHPDQGPIPHIEDDRPSAVDADAVRSAASIGATDPGSVMAAGDDEHEHHHLSDHDHSPEPAQARQG
jgi:trigger factor